MPTKLTTRAVEKSAYVITAAFTDEDGAAVVPDTIAWSLVKPDGTVVNSRSNVAYTPPAASIDVLLKDADLAILDNKAVERRHFVIEYTYDSTLGADLPGKDEAIFEVVNLRKVT